MRILVISAVILSLCAAACTKAPDADKPKTKAEENTERESKNHKSRQEALEKESENIDKRVQANQVIRELITKHNAVTAWGKELGTPKQLFTSNFQEALVRADNRPVLLVAKIDDIRNEGAKFFVEFESDMYDQEIHFILECAPDQVTVITKETSSSYDEYAFVAAISSVRRPRFAVGASPQTAEEAEVELDASTILLATGRCIDLVNIGSSNP